MSVFRVFFGLYGVAASSLIGLCHSEEASVKSPFFKSSYIIHPCQRSCVKLFHIGFCVPLFVHALLMLLIIEAALHDLSDVLLF